MHTEPHPSENWNRGKRVTRKGDIDAEIRWHSVHKPVLYINGNGHSDLDRRDLYGSAEKIIANLSV